MELVSILSIVIIFILLKQNTTSKSQIFQLTKMLEALNNKVDNLVNSTKVNPEKDIVNTAIKDQKTTLESEFPKNTVQNTEKTDNPTAATPTAEKITETSPTTQEEIISKEITAEKVAQETLTPATTHNTNQNISPEKDIQNVEMAKSDLGKEEIQEDNLNETVEEPSIESIAKKPGLWERFKAKNPDLEKFIGENLINKIGILILVLGISYFVKYAIDKDWINEPARVAIGIFAGSLVLGIAHKLRLKYASFSSVLVAGAIAIYYLTIAIGFHEYQLFSQPVAFVIMVLITAFSCLLSLSYNRMELAILSLIGGFGVPFMISTGHGDFRILFSYILILNMGILTIAYFKKWNLVNLVAFVLTYILFSGWVISLAMNSENMPSQGALLFAFLFYILFVLTNIINNLKTKGVFSNVQLSLLAANTFVFYGIGMYILHQFHAEFKGLFTASLAVLNLFYAFFLYRKFGLDKKAVYLLIGLTLTFITLAVPVQFEGNYITLFWAVEGVLLMWLAQKSQLKNYRFASVVVHLLMLISLVMDWVKVTKISAFSTPILNPVFITGMVATLSYFAVYYLIKGEKITMRLLEFKLNTTVYRKYIGYATIAILYFTGLIETYYHTLNSYEDVTASLSFTSVYHLIFTGIICYLLLKNKLTSNNKFTYKTINILAIVNLLLYVVFMVELPFEETLLNISYGEIVRISYILHFIALALVTYFVWLLYYTNKEEGTFPIYNKKFITWLFAGVLVFIASKELVLEGIMIGNPALTSTQLSALETNLGDNIDLNFDRKYNFAKNNIKDLSFKIIKTALPILWGILSFVFLIFGIRKQIKSLRIIALTLLAITIVKLFAYDISNVSETGKIIAFILLGILVLIISFVYQKIKVLVISEEEPKTDTE